MSNVWSPSEALQSLPMVFKMHKEQNAEQLGLSLFVLGWTADIPQVSFQPGLSCDPMCSWPIADGKRADVSRA